MSENGSWQLARNSAIACVLQWDAWEGVEGVGTKSRFLSCWESEDSRLPSSKGGEGLIKLLQSGISNVAMLQVFIITCKQVNSNLIQL